MHFDRKGESLAIEPEAAFVITMAWRKSICIE